MPDRPDPSPKPTSSTRNHPFRLRLDEPHLSLTSIPTLPIEKAPIDLAISSRMYSHSEKLIQKETNLLGEMIREFVSCLLFQP